jgi:uncharacterized protein YndB with AHSA1/START domain
MPEPTNTLIVTLPSDTEILLARSFDAPRWLVFEALTEPEHVAHWWGPRNSKMKVCEIDFREGGTWRYVLTCPAGKEVAFSGVYHEIVKPERLVCTECYEEPSLGNPKWRLTMTLEEANGKTTLRSHVVHPNKESRDGHLNANMEPGAAETFDRLEEILADNSQMEREIEITRVFDAPRDLVYEAWTQCEHMTQWWGPEVFTNHRCQLDVRPGGKWQITMRSPQGMDFKCGGVYSEVIRPERLAFTNDAIDDNGGILLKGFTTVIFAEQGEKTKLTLKTKAIGQVPFAPQMLKGMRAGWSGSLDKLAAYVTTAPARTA